MSSARPPFDPEVIKHVPTIMVDGSFSRSMPADAAIRLAAIRERSDQFTKEAKSSLYSDPSLEVEQVAIPGPRGDIDIAVIRPKGEAPNTNKRPSIYFIHPGGMIIGDEYLRVNVAISAMRTALSPL